eukprot:5507727-Pleurochrysis_carterae.AAC.1
MVVFGELSDWLGPRSAFGVGALFVSIGTLMLGVRRAPHQSCTACAQRGSFKRLARLTRRGHGRAASAARQLHAPPLSSLFLGGGQCIVPGLERACSRVVLILNSEKAEKHLV